MRLSPSLTAYRLTSAALSPLAKPWLEARARAGKEDQARLSERFGISQTPRPAGVVAWLHAASVGEAKVALQAAGALLAARPELRVLITTGTATSAAIVQKTAPAGVIHQFAPLDMASAVRRFLQHWRPQIAVFAESELWPNMLIEAQRAGVKLTLINARLSPKSLAGWARMPASARALLGCFSVILAADQETADGLGRLAGAPVSMLGNLKLAAEPLPVDGAAADRLRAAIAGRQVWLAASTHPGEDEIVLRAHERLRQSRPEALLIIAPRHPERGAAIAALAGGASRRSAGALPGANEAVYVADTIGEMGVLYAVCPVSMLCGSLLPELRGHNPVEPLLLGSATLHGPYVESFASVFAALSGVDGLTLAQGAGGVAAAVGQALDDPAAAAGKTARARAIIAAAAPALTQTRDALLALLPERDDATA
jgi:3-deoxy-D-manno-octulosonic-acid transferase